MHSKKLIVASIILGLTAVTAAVSGLGLLQPNLANADPTVQRPIDDFLDAQGTTITFTPPVPDQIGWAPGVGKLPSEKPPVLFAVVDYAGLAAEFLHTCCGIALGTTADGTIIERPLADGRAEVTVLLHIENALTWVTSLDLTKPIFMPPFINQFNNNPLLFGSRAQDIAADPVHNKPALGASDLHVVFINTAPSAPLPDLVCFNLGTCPAGFELIVLSFRANVRGLLHALAGLGPEGTPGRTIITQTGLVGRDSGQGRALSDAFPAERVELRAIGR